jgi:hypothetical protein
MYDSLFIPLGNFIKILFDVRGNTPIHWDFWFGTRSQYKYLTCDDTCFTCNRKFSASESVGYNRKSSTHARVGTVIAVVTCLNIKADTVKNIMLARQLWRGVLNVGLHTRIPPPPKHHAWDRFRFKILPFAIKSDMTMEEIL